MIKQNAFASLGLTRSLDAIAKRGFEEPTAIQAMAIPEMLNASNHLIAQAQTGTGKTASFGLPLIEMVDVNQKTIDALILTPTRELAIQVSEEIHSLKGKQDLRVAPIYGGQAIDQQLRRLRKGVHIVVGTPGRVLDHIKRKTLKLQDIRYLILDEADEMLNMGFIEDMEEIIRQSNPDKRMLLFSATMPSKIARMAKKYMGDYKLLKVEKQQLTTNLTEQIYFEVRATDKFEALCRIIDIEDDFYGLVFCRTKSDVDGLVNHLLDRGYDAGAIHGDISQSQREKTLNKFRSKRIQILIATDVAARGIDVNNLSHVINYSLPHDPESYVHRIGRTGRAGNQGTAITFITPSEYKKMMFIQREAKTDIQKSKLPKVEDIISARRKKIEAKLHSFSDQPIDKLYFDWARSLLEEKKPVDVLASLLNHSFGDELNPSSYGQIEELHSKSKKLDKQGTARLFVARGKKDSMTPKKLINLIASKAPVKPAEIFDIQIMDRFSFVSVPFKQAEKILAGFKKSGHKNTKPLITRARK